MLYAGRNYIREVRSNGEDEGGENLCVGGVEVKLRKTTDVEGGGMLKTGYMGGRKARGRYEPELSQIFPHVEGGASNEFHVVDGPW